MNQQNLHELLSSWGHSQQQLPADNITLKNNIVNTNFAQLPKTSPTPSRVPWLPLAFATLAVLTFFIPQLPLSQMSQIAPSKTSPQYFQEKESVKIYPPNTSGVPVTDNREFLKTNYSATIRSRSVEDLTTKVQTTIRGFGGRVDGASSSPKFGYVNFVLPANRFDAFKAELKSSVRAKFYVENIYTQNLLPQKQSIEEQQGQIEAVLTKLRNDRDQLISNHKSSVNAINTRLTKIAKELAALRAEAAVTTDPARQAEIAALQKQLTNEDRSLRSQLAWKNKKYQEQLGLLDTQIKDTEANLENIKKQDKDLLDNVATVQGTIALNWIGIWEIIDLYLPGPLISWALILAAISAYIWHRRNSQLVIPS